MLGHIDPNRVRISAWAPVVYSGHDNRTLARFVQASEVDRRETALDFVDLTRAVLTFPETDPVMTFDSAELDDVFDWSGGGGLIGFDLSSFDLPEGQYRAELVVYDAEHPRGQVLVSLSVPVAGLTLRVDQVNTLGTVPPPLADDSWLAQRTTGESISALRVVYELEGVVYKLDPSTDYVQALLGLTVTAAGSGGTLKVQRSGTVNNDTWEWSEGLVFLTGDGQLTQVPPTTGWEVVVGYAPSARRLNLSFDEPVLLE